jgi:formate dehydrogenase subunit delta
MHVDNLIKMANQIASFYASLPETETGIASVTGHITRFWEPRMRRALIAHVEGGGGGLSPLAEAAVRRLEPVASASRHA